MRQFILVFLFSFFFSFFPVLGWGQTPPISVPTSTASLLLFFPSGSFPNSVTWNNLGQNFNYSGRHFQSSTVMNNRLWVIGGLASGKVMSDVLYSTDGLNWNQASVNTPFGPRWGQASLVFNAGQGDELWVIGGTDGKSFLNDVWQSMDGVTWSQVTAKAPFAGRVRMSAAVFNHKLWVIAGKNQTGFLNDIWSSPDGKNWTQVTPTQTFPPRYSATLTVYHHGLWLIGGQASTGALNDVWFSADGVNWSNKTTQPGFPARSSHSAEVYQGLLWVFGGHDVGINSIFNDAWWSADGSAWHLANPSSNYTPRWAQSSAVFNNQLWIINGADGPKEKPVDYSDIWGMGNNILTAYSLTNNPTPSSTSTIAMTPANIPAGDQITLAPLSAKTGESIYVYASRPIQLCRIQVFNAMTVKILDESYEGSGSYYWNTTGTAPGLYQVKVNTTFADGSGAETVQEITITP